MPVCVVGIITLSNEIAKLYYIALLFLSLVCGESSITLLIIFSIYFACNRIEEP